MHCKSGAHTDTGMAEAQKRLSALLAGSYADVMIPRQRE